MRIGFRFFCLQFKGTPFFVYSSKYADIEQMTVEPILHVIDVAIEFALK
jgi:hypothetical protein